MRRIAALGTSLVIGGALVAGAAPAHAQSCVIVPPVCSLVGRQLEHVEEELGRVPGYVQYAEDTAYAVYDTVDETVRCVVFQECS